MNPSDATGSAELSAGSPGALAEGYRTVVAAITRQVPARNPVDEQVLGLLPVQHDLRRVGALRADPQPPDRSDGGCPYRPPVATETVSPTHSSPCARGPTHAPRQNRVVEQRIATTRLTDGSRIAYAVVGRGPVLVHAPGWLTHLELSWAMPPERALYESLAQGRTVVRYDKAGCGLSGAAARVPSMELELETLDAVVRAVGASRFDLYGASLGAAVAAAWTAEHPARVARLVLYGGWVRGADIAAVQVRHHVLGLIAEHWGLGSDVLADIFAPDADAATRTAFVLSANFGHVIGGVSYAAERDPRLLM